VFAAAVRARVILLAGPSGSGKTTLAANLGLPALRLDDFYREGGDPLLPVDRAGRTDWNHPNSWNGKDALAAIIELATVGAVVTPVYSAGADRRVGSQTVELCGARLFLAEGLFADGLVDDCRSAGVLADAVVLAPSAAVTFVRLLTRDIAEARKPMSVLLPRSVRLWHEQPAIVDRCVRAGMRPVTPRRARQELAGLADGPPSCLAV